MRELSRRAFGESAVVPDDARAPIEQARVQRRSHAAATEAAALRRVRAERAGTLGAETELPTSPFNSGMTASTRTRSSLRPFHQGGDRDAKDVGDADQGGEVGVALRLLQLLTFGAPARLVQGQPGAGRLP